jgi:hypothetical protein
VSSARPSKEASKPKNAVAEAVPSKYNPAAFWSRLNLMLNNSFENTIVVLIGFAGTGKYTIGRELCARTGAKLIDNHLIANPVFSVVKVDGVTPLPVGVWDKISQIRRTVYDAIRELSPPEMSFVFTVEWRENNPADLKAFSAAWKSFAGAWSIHLELPCSKRLVQSGRGRSRPKMQYSTCPIQICARLM